MDCARTGRVQASAKSIAAAKALLAFAFILFRREFRDRTSLLAERICLDNKKAPRDTPGLSGAFSRENRWQLRRERVVWLTAGSADYSGGTVADSHGLPHFPCLQNE